MLLLVRAVSSEGFHRRRQLYRYDDNVFSYIFRVRHALFKIITEFVDHSVKLSTQVILLCALFH